MSGGEDSGETGEPVEGDAGVGTEEDWPVLSELDLDVCVSDFVPDANSADADPGDA